MRLRTFCMGCGAMSLVLGCKDKGDTGPAGRFAAMGQLIDNDGAMAIVGGAVSTAAQGPLRETWRLSLRDWTWSKGPTPPFATCRGITARLGDELHIFGGSTTGWDEHAAHWRWQTADGEISTEVDDGPGPRFKHASAVDDDGARFFVLGGRNNDTGEDVYFADLWSWTEAQGWTLLPTTGGPHGLHRHVMVWDPDRQLLWVHAGFQPPREDPGGVPVRSDRLWTLDPRPGTGRSKPGPATAHPSGPATACRWSMTGWWSGVAARATTARGPMPWPTARGPSTPTTSPRCPEMPWSPTSPATAAHWSSSVGTRSAKMFPTS